MVTVLPVTAAGGAVEAAMLSWLELNLQAYKRDFFFPLGQNNLGDAVAGWAAVGDGTTVATSNEDGALYVSGVPPAALTIADALDKVDGFKLADMHLAVAVERESCWVELYVRGKLRKREVTVRVAGDAEDLMMCADLSERSKTPLTGNLSDVLHRVVRRVALDCSVSI
jgi:hypothetical protein